MGDKGLAPGQEGCGEAGVSPSPLGAKAKAGGAGEMSPGLGSASSTLRAQAQHQSRVTLAATRLAKSSMSLLVPT